MTYYEFDNDYRARGHLYIVGIDEAGRGPLAGPVYIAAVILPPTFNDARIKDSKELNENELIELSDLIKKVALDYRIVSMSADEIDTYNIYQATRMGMLQALREMEAEYHFVLSDAMPLGQLEVGHEAIVQGDAKSLSIAAASILAKVARDAYMYELDIAYPHYDFKHNKGYPTRKHLEALEIYGPVKGVHRYSYKPVRDAENLQIKLF
ncbi:MAG: ribonuclease HII [Bacilli bacterium]|nr:ribonuclease HII [Bacilli bacterium]